MYCCCCAAEAFVGPAMLYFVDGTQRTVRSWAVEIVDTRVNVVCAKAHTLARHLHCDVLPHLLP
jgi:hypothetical protein